MKTTSLVDPGSVKSRRRSSTKTINCQACGKVNTLESSYYYWLLSKEKDARCRHCGRPLRLNT